MSAFEVYCIMQLDALRNFMNNMAEICVFGVLLCFLFWLGIWMIFDSRYDDQDIESRRKYHSIAIRWGIRISISSIVMVTLAAFVPSTKTVTAMYLIPHVVNNLPVQQLPADIAAYLRKMISYDEQHELEKKTEK